MYTLLVTDNPSSTSGCATVGTASFFADASSNATFNDPGAADTYKVKWQRLAGAVWTDLADGSGTLPGGTSYSGATAKTLQLSNLNSSDNGIQLRAKFVIQSLYSGDLACSISYSSAATLTVNTVPGGTSLSCQDRNALDFTVSWAAVTSATFYELEVWNAAENVRYVNTTVFGGTTRTFNSSDFAIARGTTYHLLIRVYNNCGRSAWSSFFSTSTLDPQISRTGTGTLDFGSLTNPDCSTPQTFTIAGSQLESSAGIALTAPTYYTMSTTSGGSYTGTLNLTATGSECTGWTVANTTIYVKFCPPSTCGTYAGNVTNTSTNASNVNVAVTGISLTPAPTNGQRPTDITFSSDNGSTVVGSLTINNSTGSDNRRLVLTAYKISNPQFADAPPTTPWVPTNGTTYSVGDESDYSGWHYKVVAVNTDGTNSFTASSLNSTYVYWFIAYEYNTCSGATPVYNTSLPGYASNNPNQIKKFTISVTPGTWTPLSGTAFSAVVTALDRAGNTLAYHQGVTYNLTQNPAEGTFTLNSGTSIADGNASTTSNVTWTVTNGEINATLTATRTGGSLGWFDGSSNQFNLYCTEPTNQDQVIYFTNVTSVCTVPRYSYMTIGWVRGSNTPGSNSLVLMKAGSTPTLPDDGAELGPADRNFTNAPALSSDANTKVIWYGTGTSVSTVTALQPDVTYHVKICATYGGSPVTGSTTDGGYTNIVTNFKTAASTFNPNTRRTPACRDIALSNSTEVSSFRAASYSSRVMTTWKTETEYDNAGFELYRLCVDDGSSEFTRVASYQNEPNLVGLANSSSGKDYSYLDKDVALQIGKTYLYKLVNVTYDGTVTEQSETLVTILGTTLATGTSLDLSSVKPNPATTEVKFTVTLSGEQTVNIEVLDMTGRKVLEPANNMTLGEGMHEFTMPLPETLSSGFYTIHVTAGTNSQLQKFMLVR